LLSVGIFEKRLIGIIWNLLKFLFQFVKKKSNNNKIYLFYLEKSFLSFLFHHHVVCMYLLFSFKRRRYCWTEIENSFFFVSFVHTSHSKETASTPSTPSILLEAEISKFYFWFEKDIMTKNAGSVCLFKNTLRLRLLPRCISLYVVD
jgi:hypothetical protein